jgi:eukaryotic-like serine/threonine-protein kinase
LIGVHLRANTKSAYRDLAADQRRSTPMGGEAVALSLCPAIWALFEVASTLEFCHLSLPFRLISVFMSHAQASVAPRYTSAVALLPNSRLGPYEIIDLLGAGGMGEVYRARDPRIGREVAVKTLLARFGADPEALRRFEQEARAAGVLNHPNVLAVYDVGTENGIQYVVSELLEGQSLKDRLDLGPIPRRKAIEYALEMLRGLAAAHEKGIVHRDLKPANLFLTRDDRLKILDFGLAKLVSPTLTSSDETQAMGAATNPGIVMGSLGYMSPEQVRGHAVDHRSDIFSAGIVIYEMLSGKPAFQGDSAVECMNAILKEDPPPLEQLPAVDRVLRHCLEKRPEQRFQSARDLAFALEAAGSTTTGSSTVSTAAIPRPKARLPWRGIAAGIGTVTIAAAAFFAGHRGGRGEPPEYHRLGLYHSESLAGIVRHRFAPDGQTILVGGHHGVTFTRADNPGVRSLNLPNYRLLSVSRNGDLALLDDKDVLATVPFSGGAPRPMLEDVADADWTPDGKSVAVIRRAGSKTVVEYPAGNPVYETPNRLGSPRVSPKDDAVALFEYDADTRSLLLIRRNRERRVLSTGWTYASRVAWTPDGSEIWFSAARTGNDYPIWAVDLSGRERLVERVPGRLYVDDISRDGRVLLQHDFSRAGIAYRGPSDAAERDLSWLDLSALTAISPDGARILFSETGEVARGRLVYLRDVSGAEAIRLGEGQAVSLSPDGKSVLALAEKPGLLSILPTGAGQPRSIPGPGKLHESALLLPDGRILCWAHEAGHGSRLYIQEGTGWKAISPESGTSGAFQLVLSPAGDRVAALHNGDLMMISANASDIRAVAGWGAAYIAGWTADGKSLYRARSNQDNFEIGTFNPETGRTEPWKRIEVKRATPAYIRITPDGRSYAYTYQVAAIDAFVVSGLR